MRALREIAAGRAMYACFVAHVQSIVARFVYCCLITAPNTVQLAPIAKPVVGAWGRS